MAGLVLSSTFISYFIHRYIGGLKTMAQETAHRVEFATHHQLVLSLMSLFFVVLVIMSAWQLSWCYYSLLIPMGLLTLIYLLPIFKNARRLRDFPFIKIFMICFVWATLFIVPIYCNYIKLTDASIIFLWLEKFFFFLILTIPFDYRDRDTDMSQGVITLANTLTINRLKYIIWASAALCLFFSMASYMTGTYDITLLCSLIAFYFGLGYICNDALRDRSELYYAGWLDALILLHGLIFIVAGNLTY